jgi:hypothetical protein
VTVRAAAVALGAGRGVLAAWPSELATPGSARAEAFDFDATALAAADDAVLVPAFRALARMSQAPAVLHVALASPWSAPREVALPPMKQREARGVLVRDAARHFPALRTEPVVEACALTRGRWLAADADGVVLDAIARAARTAGFTAVRFVPAIAAWARTATSAAPHAFVVDDEAAVLTTSAGAITSVRRCRASDIPLGTATTRDALDVAARNAPQASWLELASERTQRARNTAAVRAARQFALLGFIALAVTAALQLWGGARRVALLERQRATLQPAVAPFVARRDSLVSVLDAAAQLSLSRAQARWGARLLVLSEALPDDAWFTAFRAAGDSVVVEGSAVEAASVLEHLGRAPGVRNVRSSLTAAMAADDRESFAAVVHFHAGSAP